MGYGVVNPPLDAKKYLTRHPQHMWIMNVVWPATTPVRDLLGLVEVLHLWPRGAK